MGLGLGSGLGLGLGLRYVLPVICPICTPPPSMSSMLLHRVTMGREAAAWEEEWE